jgi:acetolactate synthase-1/2/3 large subunit
VKKGAERVYADRNGSADDIWQFTDIDFSKLAIVMGCHGIQVKTPDELKAALKKSLAINKPVVINVVSDIEGIPPSHAA